MEDRCYFLRRVCGAPTRRYYRPDLGCCARTRISTARGRNAGPHASSRFRALGLTFSVVRALLRGAELRQLPVALRLHDLPIVRTFLRCGRGTFEVTGLDVPASLKPFVIGIRRDGCVAACRVAPLAI